jgi:hypothetical protein
MKTSLSEIVAFGDRELDKLHHGYLQAAREGRLPVPGDVARCGYVKRGPTVSGGRWGTADACVVCERLKLDEG